MAFHSTTFRVIGHSISRLFSGFLNATFEILPPSVQEALQWMTGTSDGKTIDDKRDILDSAVVGDVAVLGCNGTSTKVDYGVLVNSGNTTALHVTIAINKTYLTTANAIFASNFIPGSGIMIDVVGGTIRAVLATDAGSSIIAETVTSLIDGISTLSAVASNGDFKLLIDGVQFGPTRNYTSIHTWVNKFIVGADSPDGTSRRFDGDLCCIQLNDSDPIMDCRFEEGTSGLGTAYDISEVNGIPNHNDGTITAGVASIVDDIPSWNLEQGFRVAVQQTPPYIPSLADGSAAADGNPITNPGGYVHNGSEVSLIQTDFGIIDSIVVSGAGTDKFNIPYYIYDKGDGQPAYSELHGGVEGDILLHHVGGVGTSWIMLDINDAFNAYTNPATTTFPPKTGWVVAGSGSNPAPTLAYSSYWVENEEFIARSYADDLARVNLFQKLIDQWEKLNGVCLLKERVTYSQSLEETEGWYNQAVRWVEALTDECGAGTAVPFLLTDGTPFLLTNGSVFLVNPA